MSALDDPVIRLIRDAPAHDDSAALAERAVLGCLINAGEAIDRVVLAVADFSTEVHRRAFLAICDCREDTGVIDLVTVGARLADNGGAELVPYLAALAQNAPPVQNIEHYAALVRQRAAERARQAAVDEVADRLRDPAAPLEERLALARAKLDGIDSSAPGAWPAPLDLTALAHREPERPQHVIADWLPQGEVTLLAGHGGAGKSMIALHLAACVALGRPWCGLATERRRALYLSAEDRADVLHWRLARIAAHFGATLADFEGCLRVVDASQIECELMIEPGRGEEPVLTRYYDAVTEMMRGGGVLILDGASDMYGGSEIVRRHVRRFVRALRRLAPPDGAVLLLAHIDKAAARDSSATDRYSGSTAWHNSVRSRWSLAVEQDGDLVLALAKANHARAGAEIRLRWDAQAHLYVADPAQTAGGIVAAARDRQERDGILATMRACAKAGIAVPAATQGPRTAYHVLRAQPAFPDSLRADTVAVRRRFWAAIETLRVLREIEERVIRAKHRHPVAVLSPISGAS